MKTKAFTIRLEEHMRDGIYVPDYWKLGDEIIIINLGQ